MKSSTGQQCASSSWVGQGYTGSWRPVHSWCAAYWAPGREAVRPAWAWLSPSPIGLEEETSLSLYILTRATGTSHSAQPLAASGQRVLKSYLFSFPRECSLLGTTNRKWAWGTRETERKALAGGEILPKKYEASDFPLFQAIWAPPAWLQFTLTLIFRVQILKLSAYSGQLSHLQA